MSRRRKISPRKRMSATERRAASDRRLYVPVDGDTAETLSSKAFNCGRDLAPRDKRAAWLDRPEHKGLVDVYHNGQAEQFECFDEW